MEIRIRINNEIGDFVKEYFCIVSKYFAVWFDKHFLADGECFEIGIQFGECRHYEKKFGYKKNKEEK